MSYQATGYRRIKNPRIWSMHDLALLAVGAERAASPTAGAAAAGPARTPSRAGGESPSASADGPRAAAQTTADVCLRAPSSGRFWARPAPDKPAFAAVGDVIEAGRTVCLLEVMKSFHRVTYGGADAGLPERARVTAIRPADGDDLAADDVILELEPA